jgi:uncharacterized protein (TIGR00297 family)
MFIDAVIGILISLFIAGLAYYKNSLTKSGFIAAVFFGTLIYIFGGLLVWSALIAFFVSSSILTKFKAHIKSTKTDDAKGRNVVQVISNALVATVFSIVYFILNQEIFLLAAVVSIATSNSDTWASEIGVLSRGKTRYIINLKEAPRGSSGAITLLGTLASLLGAMFIAFTFIIVYALSFGLTVESVLLYGFIISFGGFIGCFIDSYLGALIQAKYKGVHSGKLTEKSWLPDEKVILASGFALITNDAVNFLSSLFASVLTVFMFTL